MNKTAVFLLCLSVLTTAIFETCKKTKTVFCEIKKAYKTKTNTKTPNEPQK